MLIYLTLGTSTLICVSGTEQLNASRGKAVGTQCPVCEQTTKDLCSHMGGHILHVAHGVPEPGCNQITGTLPCGFCRCTGEPECVITCPLKESFQYASANKGSESRPCRNVPIVCKLCKAPG
ncbi:hypothetical protein M404DRAFT_143383 [Pisolithus tinctorius Marx 270]|uniref:C2H2-type domain-containing protein n=1 Tax=Pisolithus tinctorius Marx 270 TaxID=870435 RepID=A0A0C3NU73_PISTI|nr:hypothetical protein M404DRAFT_143383 [Pisolithus tinctorius Marx 270]